MKRVSESAPSSLGFDGHRPGRGVGGVLRWLVSTRGPCHGSSLCLALVDGQMVFHDSVGFLVCPCVWTPCLATG